MSSPTSSAVRSEAYFVAGALGSGLAAVFVQPRFGWTGVCVLGSAFPATGVVVWCVDHLRGSVEGRG